MKKRSLGGTFGAVKRNKVVFASAMAIIAPCMFGSTSAMGVLVDNFSTTTLSPAYTQTTVLDQGATRNVSFQSPSGMLQGTSKGSDGAEQTLLLRSDYTLGIGQDLRADVSVSGYNNSTPGTTITSGLSQDFGIAVAATATPTITNLNGSQRSDYFYVGFRGDSSHLIANGFNGSAGIGTSQVFGINNITQVYIERDSPTVFVVGYNSTGSGGMDIPAFTFTVANPNIGNAIGFYTDERANNTIGNLDNLSITPAPEPTSLALLSLGGLLLGRRRSAKA